VGDGNVKSVPRSRGTPPQYVGSEWDRKINSPDNPNFWKFGVADLVFLDQVGDKKFVLDLGCGTGGSALSMAIRGKAQWIVGVDLLRDMVKVAKKRAADRGLGDKLCFIASDGRRLPFRPSFFDGLISRGDAFCFLVPLRATVQELKRVIKGDGVIVLEMDNRVDWKPGTTISTGFTKTTNGKTAYFVTTFTKRRDYNSVYYVLDPESRMAKEVAKDPVFQQKGQKPSSLAVRSVKKETVEVRRSPPTHWPSSRELTSLLKKAGFKEVQVMGDGLFMNLFLNGNPKLIGAMKKSPKLFLEIERALIPYVNPNGAPTIIGRAVAPRKGAIKAFR
jgi:ubiquinone/menaquinone biosynthesis C-methylase UbiE